MFDVGDLDVHMTAINVNAVTLAAVSRMWLVSALHSYPIWKPASYMILEFVFHQQ